MQNADKKNRYLTGITTSGSPHLGNYVGSIRPAILASQEKNTESFYFLADYHALIKTASPERIQRSTLEIAACWLAAGLDPEQVFFYRQSDIEEIPQLCWFLTCAAGKGMLNRAHAYKSAVDKNTLSGVDQDNNVSAGLFMYPILMAADILMFKASKVPVGRDQIQHIEMTRDVAASFNHRYGAHFIEPEAVVDEGLATLLGLDGRKMSKSYDNTIPIFCSKDELKKHIYSIVTDSSPPGVPKNSDNSVIFQIYQAFSSKEETDNFRKDYANGLAWGEAKKMLFERLNQKIEPMREKYVKLIGKPRIIESILQNGANKARKFSKPFMDELRNAVGLRSIDAVADIYEDDSLKIVQANNSVKKIPIFKQYRKSDGLFYFKLIDGADCVVLQSLGFDSPKDVGQAIAQLKIQGIEAVHTMCGRLENITVELSELENSLLYFKSVVT
jgi:tryptophanyl-tRNA synthetase